MMNDFDKHWKTTNRFIGIMFAAQAALAAVLFFILVLAAIALTKVVF